MKILLAVVFLTGCLSNPLKKVMVQDGDFIFPLKDVKELWDMMDMDSDSDDDKSQISTLCKDSDLPEVFQPVCGSPDGPQVFHRLMDLWVKADVCEICAYAACSGC